MLHAQFVCAAASREELLIRFKNICLYVGIGGRRTAACAFGAPRKLRIFKLGFGPERGTRDGRNAGSAGGWERGAAFVCGAPPYRGQKVLGAGLQQLSGAEIEEGKKLKGFKLLQLLYTPDDPSRSIRWGNEYTLLLLANIFWN